MTDLTPKKIEELRGVSKDPVEAIVERALQAAGIRYFPEREGNPAKLDFWLPDHCAYIECKAYFTERSETQLRKTEQIILVQGNLAAKTLAEFIFPKALASASGGEDAELCKRLEIKADMIQLGEGIAWGSDSEIMREAAARIRSLSAQLAEARREMDAYRDAFGCLSCGEDHPVESMCPPHEVRSSGMGSHRQQIGKAVARATASEAQAAALRERVGEADRLLIKCFNRIHTLPRTSDTELADAISNFRARTALEGRE